MFVFSPNAYGKAAIWPTFITAANPQETRNIAAEQAWEQRGLVTTPNYLISDDYLPPYYGSVREANGIAGLIGLGDASGAISQGVSIGSSVGSTALSTAAVQGALGISAAAAGFATLGIGAAAAAVIMFLNRKGPKQKVASTKIVDEAEPILKQNRDQFLAGPKTDEAKEYALAVFNQVWASVVAACGDQSLGNPGKACISDRQRGGKWDWFSYYYDPINSVDTKPAASVTAETVTGQVGSVLAPVLGSNWDVLLGGGLLLIGLVSFLGDKKG